MTICFGRFDSEISDLKKTHTNNGLDGIKKGITKLVSLGWGCERRRGGTSYFSKRDFFSWVLTSYIVLMYTVGTPNAYFDKNMLLLKNPQYLPDHYETLTQ